MLTRRAFAACALCAAGGFLAAGVDAENAPAGGLKRTLLRQTDGPADGYVTVEMKVEIDPGAPIARHTHPGIESGYIIEGGTDLAIDGVGALTLNAGRRLSGADRRSARRQERPGEDDHRGDLRRRKRQAARLARPRLRPRQPTAAKDKENRFFKSFFYDLCRYLHTTRASPLGAAFLPCSGASLPCSSPVPPVLLP